MIDKLGDDKSFRGAYAYHLAVRDKINELVEAVNKLESHKHEIDNWNEDYHCPIPTSEPIMQSEELPNHIPADTFYKRDGEK
jgi:trans-aconitate methyltransferase